jgi:hypothetical protein
MYRAAGSRLQAKSSGRAPTTRRARIEIQALRSALIEGEASGSSGEIDFGSFIEGQRLLLTQFFT